MKKLYLVLGFLALTVLSTILDVIFFKNMLYVGIAGASAIFFIRSITELAVFGLGIMFGYMLIKTKGYLICS